MQKKFLATSAIKRTIQTFVEELYIFSLRSKSFFALVCGFVELVEHSEQQFETIQVLRTIESGFVKAPSSA